MAEDGRGFVAGDDFLRLRILNAAPRHGVLVFTDGELAGILYVESDHVVIVAVRPVFAVKRESVDIAVIPGFFGVDRGHVFVVVADIQRLVVGILNGVRIGEGFGFRAGAVPELSFEIRTGLAGFGAVRHVDTAIHGGQFLARTDVDGRRGLNAAPFDRLGRRIGRKLFFGNRPGDGIRGRKGNVVGRVAVRPRLLAIDGHSIKNTVRAGFVGRKIGHEFVVLGRDRTVKIGVDHGIFPGEPVRQRVGRRQRRRTIADLSHEIRAVIHRVRAVVDKRLRIHRVRGFANLRSHGRRLIHDAAPVDFLLNDRFGRYRKGSRLGDVKPVVGTVQIAVFPVGTVQTEAIRHAIRTLRKNQAVRHVLIVGRRRIAGKRRIP